MRSDSITRTSPSISREQRNHLKKRLREEAQTNPAILALRRRLLRIGGVEIVPNDEGMVGLLLALGHIFDNPIVMRRGEPGHCHSNSARLFMAGRAVAIGTGWALSDDGLWRQHTWAIDRKGRIIETTEEREAYFGFYMVGEAACLFAETETAGGGNGR